MRCKVGDLAMVVGGLPEFDSFLGRVCHVVAWRGDWYEWETDMVNPDGCGICYDDRDLRPIRDSDGQDETLTWKERETA